MSVHARDALTREEIVLIAHRIGLSCVIKAFGVGLRTGLIPLVKVPTRGKNILDMLMAPADTEYNVKVISSAARSDHKAILATSGALPGDRTRPHPRRTFRRRTPGQHATMLQALSALGEGDRPS